MQPNVPKRGLSIRLLLQEDINKLFNGVRHNIINITSVILDEIPCRIRVLEFNVVLRAVKSTGLQAVYRFIE
jgi:hypothetical protein